MSSALNVAEIDGLRELWAETLGDPRICIAILDGPVEQSHPGLESANLKRFETLVPCTANQGSASQHGTHIASIIFGQHEGPIKGIAPDCSGLIIPVFRDGADGSIIPCSQIDLARAISLAMQEGARIINISGGELTPSGSAHPILADVVRNCANKGVLIVAATGNEGCDCLHIPAALPSVLAVGAMSSQGFPLDFSNWGKEYQTQGIIAPGEGILGATPGGGIVMNSGTSYATPIVSGIVALLLSLQLKYGLEPDPYAVRSAILSSAVGCNDQPEPECDRLLAGRLNIRVAMSKIITGGKIMSVPNEIEESVQSQITENIDPELHNVLMQESNLQTETSESNRFRQLEMSSHHQNSNTTKSQKQNFEGQKFKVTNNVNASSCGYEGCTSTQIVFAIGQPGYDFGTEARRDSIMQHMDPPGNPHDPVQLLAYLEKNPWDAASIIWTLNLNATPVYAIQAQGAFASDVYRRLHDFLGEQIKGEVERVSIPGYLTGSVALLTGQIVPAVWPELRGMYSWNTAALVKEICGAMATGNAPQKGKEKYPGRCEDVENFLLRIYDELRNLGMTPQERAMNYAATNAFQVGEIFKDAIKQGMELDTIEVERSSICRPGSDCWDVKLTFFNPAKVFEQARKLYRFAVDVSDVVPVMVGPVRSWFVR